MRDETQIGGGDGRFPKTRWSLVLAARSADPAEQQRALDRLVAVYWKPVYKLLRLRWRRSNEDAKDLTQEFFARLIEKRTLEGFDPAKARLRTYLRTCLDRLVQNHDRGEARLKRGGGEPLLSLDFDAAEGELGRATEPAGRSTEELFEREWVRSLFGLAVEALEAECAERGKEVHFRLFERYDLGDEPTQESRAGPTYADLAREFDLPVTTVTNHLAWARREFRRLTLEKLRETTASDEEFRGEARALLGWEA
jgi:RNA polymerase sigma factor (sigma-70 family)